MQLADWLRERLSGYGMADVVEIHSYMWVVAYLGPATTKKRKRRSTRDFPTELELRQKRAMERERRGLMGERHVFNHEVDRLNNLGKTKLANQVEMVSFSCTEGGFDIRSYDDEDKEIHIEVKTTISNETNDRGFGCLTLSALRLRMMRVGGCIACGLLTTTHTIVTSEM